MAHLQVIILGGGFGGLAAAHRLRERLGDHVAITLVDRRSTFMMGLRILWTIVGRGDRPSGTRALDALSRKGIRVLRAGVTAIDPLRKQVVTTAGTVTGDALIVALGAELRPDLLPGYDPTGSNLYDLDEAERIAARVDGIDRGRIGIGILGAPYKCPPAPYEAAFLVEAALRQRGVRNRVDIEVFTPLPFSLPVAGRAMSGLVEEMLAARGIGFLPARTATAVEGREVVFGAERRAYDLLLAVPPHRAPSVVKESGLTLGEWIRPDRHTCEIPDWLNVFAVGDVTEVPTPSGMTLPKAGVFAEAMGRTAAEVIADRFAGGGAPVYDGAGFCFVETGDELATAVRGNFYATPEPAVEFAPPSRDALAEKRAFEATRLTAWF
jgi:sulfide:quinone oxidoreductase